MGGLVATVIHNGPDAGVYFPVYDGNGNVTGYVRASDGGVVAQYEYGPFGELLRATGPLAKDFNHLFSTKYFDWETGLSYYGHRYYSSTAGRWLSRDLIEENGGVNLYGFVYNRPITHIDADGRVLVESVVLGTTLGTASSGGAGVTLTITAGGGSAAAVGAGGALVAGGVWVAGVAVAGLAAYQVYEIHKIDQQNAQAEVMIQEQEQLLKELQENQRKEPRAYAKVAESLNPKTCCKFIWDAAGLGGNAAHHAYISRLFQPNYELIVIAPDGETARYDAGSTFPGPVTAAYEAKTGRRWAGTVKRPEWTYVMNKIFSRDLQQFGRQQRVALKCKLSYSIFFQQRFGFVGYSQNAPQYAPYYQFRP
ncbi:RHS repeat-associated core domain-containing protein [Fontisphaera persica]|uniref:RHS repeat-associated core domain-containing protein n=1 Tax=Fontisphaera persica TaxID=2974023 RepID=UPI0024C0E246|nr:RHS repeat-associated core domain-containing protein [Fontisphaera persica]WCJ58191.1 RHS repeat-associated core domain-containing protein [Fontisphaera persica]